MPAGEGSIEAIALRFIEAFNRRDTETLVALTDPGVAFHPTRLTGPHDGYRGHEGMRDWVERVMSAALRHEARVREVRILDRRRFLVLSEVWVDGEFVSPSAMLARLSDEGKIVEARAYLSDEDMLVEIGILPGGDRRD